MTLLEQLMSYNGREVTIKDYMGAHLKTISGVLKVETSSVYPYIAYLEITEEMGGFFVENNILIGESQDKITIVLNSPTMWS